MSRRRYLPSCKVLGDKTDDKQMESEELIDEIGAIELIYPDHVKKLAPLIYEFNIPQHETVRMQMSFPELYPEEKPDIIQVNSDKTHGRLYDDKYLESLFDEVLDSIFTEDMVCIFDFFTELDAILYDGGENETSGEEFEEPESEQEEEEDEPVEYEQDIVQNFKDLKVSKTEQVKKPLLNPMEGWIASEPITDRKSTFQAFIKEVHSVDEAMDALELLKQDRKIMRSRHNMTAYRIKNGDIRYQDFDDDGESAAGGRMLHLLTIMDLWNCIAVVSRWFGGVHIGPDRFKHINSTTREAVVKSGLGGEESKKNSTSKGKKKK